MNDIDVDSASGLEQDDIICKGICISRPSYAHSNSDAHVIMDGLEFVISELDEESARLREMILEGDFCFPFKSEGSDEGNESIHFASAMYDDFFVPDERDVRIWNFLRR